MESWTTRIQLESTVHPVGVLAFDWFLPKCENNANQKDAKNTLRVAKTMIHVED